MESNLRDAYTWHRQTAPKLKTYQALALARLDVASGTSRYPSAGMRGTYWELAGSKRMLWLEKPSAFGFRFVGFADEVARRIDHKGWFLTDAGCGDAVRGCVYQLPGRDGKPVYVSAYADPHNGDASLDGPAAIDCGTLWEGERSDWHHSPKEDSEARAAAYAADKLAERLAESERDYDRAWQAGNMWREAVEEIQAQRETIKGLLAERRKVKGVADVPTICATLRASVSSSLARIQSLRTKRDNLASGDYSTRDSYYGFSLRDPAEVEAFNEGAGKAVLA